MFVKVSARVRCGVLGSDLPSTQVPTRMTVYATDRNRKVTKGDTCMYNNQKQPIVHALDIAKAGANDSTEYRAKSHAPLSRRHFLQFSGAGLAGVLLAACAAPGVQPAGDASSAASTERISLQ